MKEKELIKIFEDCKALLSGHFLLRSGLHSDRFFQAALILQYPAYAKMICSELAKKIDLKEKVDAVISPAIGGIIVGHELAAAIGVKSIFAEKENDNLVLRRGFSIERGQKIIVAEDVVTKGGRSQQTIDLVRSYEAEPVCLAVLVDRSGGTASFDVPFTSLIKLDLQSWEAAKCPLCKQGIPIVKPGSK
ncbi:MAG TPA: orotate phosphoribosyltransferase, partial [Victivallales bacterium]|nr:orotate phosphoribosyltransferase [Victivallales bacterium]HRR06463.1 orotate phosphoribosyltransferase [Victivallales bacterium]HRR27886.1 orotate phosphoribosyltransferase [Victivallales bacterium]HRU01707.1 orotate phosphoribosyltransferase [Victivallales bacterium]